MPTIGHKMYITIINCQSRPYDFKFIVLTYSRDTSAIHRIQGSGKVSVLWS